MNIKKHAAGVATAYSNDVIISDTQSALDLIASVQYETGLTNIIINKEAFCDEFFDLRTGIAGEVLQKFVNYGWRIAITGDFSVYTSKALRDFIYECNNGRNIYFVLDEEAAVSKLTK